ncbi:hypothetical protein GQ44DRAFT_809886 [Phaeosphaeriaceae sp. PMI808]|nr:hypothetical protein GQ44DRAFT_809886 [Phaeosphaeriaceae sp. PMI808]
MLAAPATNGVPSASLFWARKNREVKSATGSLLHTAEPPKQLQNTHCPVKKRFLLKDTLSVASSTTLSAKHDVHLTNGATSGSRLKANWTDSDEDEDFLANFSAKEKSRFTILENEVTQKAAQIEALEAAVHVKDSRIQQLEGLSEQLERQAVDLKTSTENSSALMEQLKNDYQAQYMYVQELVAEVDEKSRRIHELKAGLDSKGARIHELLLDLEAKTQTVSVDIDEVAAEMVEEGTPLIHETKDSAIVEENQVESQTVLSAGGPLTSLSKSETSTTGLEKEKTGPATNDSKFPKLWSPEMSRNTAPVEKPKVLKMAIDTSLFGKKSQTLVKHPQLLTNESIPTTGQSNRHRSKTDVVPNISVTKDIRHLPHQERMLFANGPKVDVVMGSTKLASLPKYVLMQCSTKASKHFAEDPSVNRITFSEGSMDVDAAKAHFQWMDEMTYQGRVYSITLNSDERYNEKNLKICQAARVIGLNNTYVGHFTKVFCDRVRSNNLSLDLISMICERAYLDNDPIYDCLVNNLVNRQMNKGFKELKDLDQLLLKYPILRESMAKVRQHMDNARTREKRRGTKPKCGDRIARVEDIKTG